MCTCLSTYLPSILTESLADIFVLFSLECGIKRREGLSLVFFCFLSNDEKTKKKKNSRSQSGLVFLFLHIMNLFKCTCFIHWSRFLSLSRFVFRIHHVFHSIFSCGYDLCCSSFAYVRLVRRSLSLSLSYYQGINSTSDRSALNIRRAHSWSLLLADGLSTRRERQYISKHHAACSLVERSGDFDAAHSSSTCANESRSL